MNNDATTNSPASTETSDSDASDAVNSSTARVYFGPVQSPEKRLIASGVARRHAALHSALHPSSLSPLPDLPSPQGITDAPDEGNERSDEDGGEISDVAAHLSREDTPENDTLNQNEPSSVLASRIMRASDNPSPPPRTHLDLVMQNGRTSFPDISAPPSPFRPINLRERLDQFAAAERPLSPGTPMLQVFSDQHPSLQDSGSGGNISQPDLISFESCSALAQVFPTEPVAEGHSRGSPIQNLPSGATNNIDDLLSQSPQCPPVVPSLPRVDGVEQSESSDSLDELGQGHVPVDAESGPPHPSSASPLIATSSALDTIKEHTRSPVRRSARLSMTPRPLPLTHAPQSSETSKKGKSRTAIVLPEGVDSTIRDEPAGDHCHADPPPDIQRSPEEKERRMRRRGLNGKLETPNLKRELGSLSPQSAEVLARLLPADGSTLLPEGQPLQPLRELSFGSLDPQPSTPQRPNSNPRHPNFSLTAIQRPLFAPTPIRPIGGLSGPSSPLKFSVTVDDVSRTPARRVPIQDAFAQGSASAQNAMLLSAKRDASTRMTMRSPVFSRPALDDVSRSPAKRVFITDLNSPMRMRSPTRPAASPRARSASVEPKLIFPQPLRSHSVDPSPRLSRFVDGKGKEPMFPKLSSKPRSGVKLPFPLVPSQKAGTDLPHSIPEEAEGSEVLGDDLIVNGVAASSSPLKSSLKKPSTGSRIPRIGAKPYARPQPKKTVSSAATKLPAFGAGQRASFKLAAAGSSSSDESHAAPPNHKLEGNSAPETSVLSTLKRKRGVEETVKSPPITHSVMIRQVVPGILGGKYAPKGAPELPTPAPALPEPSPRKPPGPMKFRKVEPGVISARYVVPSKPAESNSSPADDSNSSPQTLVQSEAQSTQPSLLFNSTILPAPPENEPLKSTHNIVESQETADASSSRQSTESLSRGRRTSRRRPAAQHANDVFDTSASTQPLNLRRSRRSEGDGFLGMSATALQALTNSNTTKNQQVFSKLEREIIRKEGIRPESPTVKVRTILQKQREARDRQRLERAERRARRSEDGPGLSDTEGASDLGDQSMVSTNKEHDENEGVVSSKHRRGPGEVEDYETPERPDRPVKRLRFGDDTHEEAREHKRVKWHRGLSTEIYLDQVEPQPSRSKDVIIEKSCLAPTAKSLRLDTLGNLVDTEQHPLVDLDQENIVVKKYVYDNDVEVVKEVIPPKITRSKSKKLKS